MPEQLINLTVKNRQGGLLSSLVKSFSTFNAKGQFGILPNHSNFISIIEKSIVYTDQDNKENKFDLEKGVLKVSNNTAEVFLEV